MIKNRHIHGKWKESIGPKDKEMKNGCNGSYSLRVKQLLHIFKALRSG